MIRYGKDNVESELALSPLDHLGTGPTKNDLAIPRFSVRLNPIKRLRAFPYSNSRSSPISDLSPFPAALRSGSDIAMEDLQDVAEQIFATALSLDPGEREAYLGEVCRNAPEVRSRVETLLNEDDLAGSFLERPLLDRPLLDRPLLDRPLLDRPFLNRPFLDRIPSEFENAIEQDANSQGGHAESLRYRPQFEDGDLICDRFRVMRFIAKGGMGEVYEVEDRQLRGVHVALKTILSQYAADPLMQERFEREVLNAREVVHPNICPIYDIFHWNRPQAPLTFLTMKLLPGETLSARISRAGAIAEPEASLIVRQVGAGLAAAHDAGILHRDIKAANIILDGAGDTVHACVTDFGLARAALGDATTLTLHGMAGTPGYMAPELFYGSAPSRASDVFSFGIVSYQILTGHLPHFTPAHEQSVAPQTLGASAPEPWRKFLAGCLNPSVEKRFTSIPAAIAQIPSSVTLATPFTKLHLRMSRRRMIGLGAAICGGLAGSAWLEWPDIQNLVDPLPETRSVALMAWPVSGSPALLSTILDSISQRLARAEAYEKDLLIITSNDVPAGGIPMDSPAKSESILGANLVLVASMRRDPSQVRINLQLLEAATQRVLRAGMVSSSVHEISTLAEKACQEAASLLRLPRQDVQLSDPEELRKVSKDVYDTFTEAEDLMKQPNHAGLQQAILKYQQALDLDNRFALGYAKVATAYMQQYLLTKDTADIELAAKNTASALRYNPNSAQGLMSQALLYLSTGKNEEAYAYFSKALASDPGNPQIMNYKASALTNEGLFAEAEKTYKDIIAARPNYWPAYNDLGLLLNRQAKYREAAKMFASAGAAAPTVALPMANLGAAYLLLAQREDARLALTESLKRGDNLDAYLNLGDIDFEDAKYTDALHLYEKAGKLNPRFHLIQRNMGDCYAMLGNTAMMKQCYGRAADLLAASLAINPRNGFSWANLAFYHAKVGDAAISEADMKRARAYGSRDDVELDFMIAQTLCVLGKRKEALALLVSCIDRRLSEEEVNLALDLKELRKDPEYLQHVKDRKIDNKVA